jgi:threonine/homoserine/homoserine lactone efflux protein
MALGAAASFALLASNPLHLAVLLGLVLSLASAFSLSLWCTAGLMLARLLRTPEQWRVLNTCLGVLLALSILPMWLD